MLHALLKCGNVARSSSHAPLEECSPRATTNAELKSDYVFALSNRQFHKLNEPDVASQSV